MKLYLHIGLSKTGTTAIQNFLWNYRKKLLNDYSILYPNAGISHRDIALAHHELAVSIYKPEEAKSVVVQDIREYEKKIIKEIEITSCNKIILSSEVFMHIRFPDSYEKLKNFLNKITKDLTIIVYFRRQDIWHESSYSQVIKDYFIKESVSFNSSVSHSKSLTWLLFFDKFLSRWQAAFPNAQIIPRIYDRKLFPEGNVILDFLSILGIDMPEAKEYKIESNPSLSHLSTLVLRKINEKFDLSPEEHGKVVQYLFKLDREEGSPLKTFFTLQERIEFLEHFRESNERFFREWFGTENKFLLTEEEIKFYEEQDKIPMEYIEKMVEDRYRKVLVYMMEERVLPKHQLLEEKIWH